MSTTSEESAQVEPQEVEPSPSGPPPLGFVGFLRWCWRQLTSMRTALILLFLLALAAIPGSVLPQRGTDPIKVNDWIANNPVSGPVLDRLGFFDVFASPWFAAIYLLLFISVIGCVIPRTLQHLRAARSAPPAAPSRLDRLPGYRTWTRDGASPQDVLDAAQADLEARRWRTSRGEDWVAGEKGYLRETGNLLFHIALIALLVSVAYGSLFGWRGTVIVREGTGFSNTLTQYDAWGGGRLVNPASLPPFSFTLDTFNVEFERGVAQRGAPRLFEANVTVRDQPGAPAQAETIEVNHPLNVDGATVYLVGHGYAPIIQVRDSTGRLVVDEATVFLPQDGNFTSTGVVKAPDAQPSLGLQGLFLPTAALDQQRGPHSTFPAPDDPALFMSAWIGDLGLDAGTPQSVYRLDTSRMTEIGLKALRPGESWTLPQGAGTVTLVGWQRWASFQIAHDPGKLAALGSAMLALAGLLLSLFVRRRRVWVRVAPAGPGITVVSVAGLIRSDEGEVSDDVDRLTAALQEPARSEEGVSS